MFDFPAPRRLAGAAVVACLLSSYTLADDAKPNPAYEGWAKCKPGATTVVKGSTEAMGNKSSQTITTKLVELTPEKAVVETTVSIEAMGQTMKQPAQKQDIPKTMTMPAMPPGPAGRPMKMPTPKQGEDTISAVGKELKCQTTEVAMDQNGMKINSKTWTSAEVPGGLVKMVSSTTGAMTSTTTMELVEFKDGN